MIHLSAYNTSYGQKKVWESKCQFDSQPLKVRNHLELCVCKYHAAYSWKGFDKGYNFPLDIASIKYLHKKLWVSKVPGVLISKISRCLTWKSQKKWHLGATPMASHKEYYKGEGDGFPQILDHAASCESVIRPCFVRAPRVLQLCINQLVV
jgi:hypothetical protein